METKTDDANAALMLDGNAAAGLLMEIFTVEMTAAPAECGSCGKTGPIGALLAYNQCPGLILRCAHCHNIVLRVVRTPNQIYLDARGAAYLCIPVTEADLRQ